MLSVLDIFFNAERTRPYLVLFCLLLAGIFEAVSLSALLPAATQISGGASEGSSALNAHVTSAVQAVGLEPTLGLLISIVVIAMVAKSGLSFAALTYAGYSEAVVATDLRRRLLKALFDADWAYFSDLQTGNIASAISQNAMRAGMAYTRSAKFISLVLQGFVYGIVAFMVSPRVALAGCAVGAVLVVCLSGLVRLGRRAGYKQTDRTGELVAHVTDALGNIKPIKSMARQGHFLAYSADRIRKLKRALVNIAVSREGLYYGQDGLAAIAIGIGVYTASTFWQVPLAELVVVGIIFFQVIAIIRKTQTTYQNFSVHLGAYNRTTELIADLEAHREIDAGAKAPEFNDAIRLEHVRFSHGDMPVIHDASFDVPAGSITVLQGPSGSGKTTLIDLIIGLHKPVSGTITIDGEPLEDIALSKWRAMIGYVPQELNLLHGSILTNVTMGNEDTSRDDVVAALELAGAMDFVSRLANGIDTVVGEMGSKLSGGQRQRISLARALVFKPKLLILDEVTSALDPQTEQAICDHVAALKGQYTIVAITHRPAWAKIATRLYQVDGGRITDMTARADAAAAAGA